MVQDVFMGSWEFAGAFCVGRSRGCEVSIATCEETRTVSKRHVGVVPMTESLASSARVGAVPGARRWLLYDLETMNGTAVNGVELPTGGTCELRHGDEVVLASTMRQCVRLLVEFPDDACSRIVVKALARPATPTPSPMPAPAPAPRAFRMNASSRRTAAETPPATPRRHTNRMTAPSRGTAMIIDRMPAATPRRLTSIMAASSGRSEAGTPGTGCRSLGGVRSADATVQQTPHSLPQKRSRSSPRRSTESENVEDNRQDTPSSQQRKRSRRGGAPEEDGAALEGAASKRARDHEKEERERLMVCPVCLEYFHGSATLPCSHTFCGYCISNWFRTALSCPECRDVVKTVPVRNRALDELVERLVGNTDAYKSHVKRRARLQRESVGSRGYEEFSDQEDRDDESEGAMRGVGSLRLGNSGMPEPSMRSSVFSRWSVEEKLAFSSYISSQFGETRVSTCKKVGLTEAAVDGANVTELLVAAQNLLLDCGGLRIIGDECCQRLKIFLLFG